MYAYADIEGLCEKDYSAHVKINIEDDDEGGEPFTEEELKILWKNEKNPEIELLLIMCYSGYRIAAYKTLKVNLDDQYFQGGLKTKAGKDRIVPIHPGILTLVKRRIKRDGGLLVCSVGKYRKSMYGALEMLGIEKHTPHDLSLIHIFSPWFLWVNIMLPKLIHHAIVLTALDLQHIDIAIGIVAYLGDVETIIATIFLTASIPVSILIDFAIIITDPDGGGRVQLSANPPVETRALETVDVYKRQILQIVQQLLAQLVIITWQFTCALCCTELANKIPQIHICLKIPVPRPSILGIHAVIGQLGHVHFFR